MSYCWLLPAVGAAICLAGWQAGGWGRLALWLGGDFVLLGLAHAGRNPRLLGKRPDGRLAAWSWAIGLPLHSLSLGIFHLTRLLGREAPWDRLDGEVYVGRRLLAREVPSGCRVWVDLTAEFQEPAAIRRRPGYRAFPVLDGSVPTLEELERELAAIPAGPIFIHCAQGHGRTGLFAAALLIARGQARTAEEAVGLIQKARPGVRLNRAQWDRLRACARRRSEGRPA